MIIIVTAGEEIQHRHLLGIEGGDIRRQIVSSCNTILKPAATFRFSINRRQKADDPAPCRINLFSLSRPTMSKFRYAATFVRATGGCSTKCDEPINPISSPDQSAKMTPRRKPPAVARDSLASAAASSSTVAVPEALSSAPG